MTTDANALARVCLGGFILAAIGCGSAVTPSENAGSGGAAAGSGAPATTFSEVYDMMFPMPTNARCNACHGLPANDVSNGNLHMGTDRASAYAALVGKNSTSSRCMNRPLVSPGKPESSLLFEKLSANPPCGSRMPLGGTAFSDAQLAMIRSWIAAGAKDD